MVMRSTQVVIKSRIGILGNGGRRREKEVGGRGVFQVMMARRLAVGSARGRMLMLLMRRIGRGGLSSGNDIVKRRNGRRIVKDGLRMAVLLTLGLFASQTRFRVGRDGRH